MATVTALSTDDLTTVGIVVTLVLVIGGFVLGLVITALIGRVIVAVVVVVLAILVWQQRSRVEDSVDRQACKVDASYFGVHVDPPDSVRQRCDRQS